MYLEIFLKKIIPYAFILLGFVYISAQDVGEEAVLSAKTILEQNNLSIRANQDIPVHSSTDSAYIYQIGANNESSIRVSGADSNVNLLQNGNFNKAGIQLSSRSLDYNMVQNGDGNILLDYGNGPHLNLQRTIFQNGDNQNVVIFGSNSLTKNMVLNVQGNSEMVTVRNFN